MGSLPHWTVHYWRCMLCRGPLALGKGPETLGKGFAEGCPRQRPLGEFLDGEGVFVEGPAKPLPRARTALGKEKNPSRAGAVGGFFAEGRPSAKKWFFFNLFAEGRPSANKFFYFFLKNLCRGPAPWPSAKKLS